MPYGNDVQLLRESHKPKMSQQDLADRVGIKRPYLSQIENQKYFPSKEVAEKISSVLGSPELLKTFEKERHQVRGYISKSEVKKNVGNALKALARSSDENKKSWKDANEAATSLGLIVFSTAFSLDTKFDCTQAAMDIIHTTQDWDSNKIFFHDVEKLLEDLRDSNQSLQDEAGETIEKILSKLKLDKN